MSITLVFHGGLFVPFPGAGKNRRVDVQLYSPRKIRVSAEGRVKSFENRLNSPNTISFVSEAPLQPEVLPLRRISHLTPINHYDFKKTVSFTGGLVTGIYDKEPPWKELKSFAEPQDPDNLNAMLKKFKLITGIKSNKYDKAYKKGFVQEFYATPDVRWWMKGYRIEVTLPKGTKVFKDNGATPIPGLVDGMRIEFPVAKNSPIPHGPLNNPHVLEQPPTF
jgi:hypothetical protein